jgi:dTDP-4-dehydrorhamnose 3,5-epimerase-like enzyme
MEISTDTEDVSLAADDGIPDLLIEQLQIEIEGTHEFLRLLSFDDHMLRRFGQLDLIRKEPGNLDDLYLRVVADEVWFMVEGAVRCICRDMRPGSPSQDQEVAFELSTPTRVLVPFGVAFGWQAIGSSALMLRCSTHQDGDHQEDRAIPIEVSK